MLRKFLDFQLSLTEEGRPLHKIRPLISAGDTFLYEPPITTSRGPHIRDALDVKRWMLLVVVALLPCFFMGIWNTGLQSFVYSSGDFSLMNEYIASSGSFSTYFDFVMKEGRIWNILWEGSRLVIPLVILIYAVGGLWEGLFACVRGHEISEGFLVTGILYALILPPTIPYWMAIVGVSVGTVLAKEVFGGSGMNIVNPALACRAFLFFTYPGRMSGSVWVGGNPTVVRESLVKMNQDAATTSIDSFTQATKLAVFNVTPEIKRVHVDAIATNEVGTDVSTIGTIQNQFNQWTATSDQQATLGQLSQEQMQSFVTTPLAEGGLGLSTGYYEDAFHFSSLQHDVGTTNSDWGFFLGNKLGCIGETSTLACLLGAIFLIYTGIGSWRTMIAMGLGAYLTALCFQWGSSLFGAEGGAWAPAQFGFPAYKHLILGGLAFGLVFMATDPVSSPSMNGAKWMYGAFCGIVSIIIRVINPAFPEGVMLAILMGNVFAPLFDYYNAKFTRKRRTPRVAVPA